MEQDVLVLNGLSKDILDKLSYKSNLGISLKRNLHYFTKEDVMNENGLLCQLGEKSTCIRRSSH